MKASQVVPEGAGTALWTLGWRWILSILALLASLVAVATLVLGAHDAMIAAALVPRLIGLLLTVCGVALLAAALLVFRYAGPAAHRTDHLWVVPALFLAGAVPGLLLLVLQISAFVFGWRVLVELVAFLVPVAAAVIVLGASQAGDARPIWGPLWHQSRAVKAVASFLSAGLVVTAGQTFLGYYKPVRRPDSLSVSIKLALAHQHLLGVKKGGDVQALHGTVSVENTSDVRLLLLGGIYLVTGHSVTLRSGEAQAELLQRTLPEEMADPRLANPIGVGRYETKPKISLVKTGIVDPGTSWIAPGTKAELEFGAYAPKNQFPRYISTVQLITARADRLELDAPRAGGVVPGQFAEVASVIVTRKIVEASWVNLVTRGTRYLYINYSVPPDRILTERGQVWPGVTVCIAYKMSQCADSSDQTQKRIRRWRASTYGVTLFPAYSLEMPAQY